MEFEKKNDERWERQEKFNKTITKKIDSVAFELKETKLRNNLK